MTLKSEYQIARPELRVRLLAAFEMRGLLTNYFFAKAWRDISPLVDDVARNSKHLSAKLGVGEVVDKMLHGRVKPQANEAVLEAELAKVRKAMEARHGSEVADAARAGNDIAVLISRLESSWVDISPSGWNDLWTRALNQFPVFLMRIGVNRAVITNTRKQTK